MNASRCVRLYFGEQNIEQADHDLAQGLVCVRSVRSPERITPNEDAAAVIEVGPEALVLAVADGVGGTPAGREASNLALKTLTDVLLRQPETATSLRTPILDAVEEANKKVLELARGAATTLVIGEIITRRLRSYHVGDSELIGVGQRGRIKQRIVPHSPTGFAVEAGLLDQDEAVQHDQRHVLFNVLGSPDMRVEVGTALRLADYDTVLLASDGLLDNLFVDEIVDIIRMGPLPEAADRLVKKAQARMNGDAKGKPSKPDDLTVILYRPHRSKAPRRKHRGQPGQPGQSDQAE
jgi:serine/threonine protein phosphatase PrpC